MREVGDCEVAVGRELTKVHEQLVRGQISSVLTGLTADKGEFTVVVYIGQMTENVIGHPLSGESMLAELGEITENDHLPRRKAINVLARRHGLAPNRVYEILEEAKKSG